MSEALIRLHGVRLGYGRRAVLDGLDLAVEPGDFIGLRGPNGSGKTTLFRALLGLLRAQAGRIERRRLRVGYVPQRESLDPLFPLSVAEVVELGSPARPPRSAPLEALERVRLRERARDAFASLSGGQRQRVLLARALMVDPELLVLDEPTSGVDDESRRVIEALLSERNAAGATVLLVSHDHASLERCARTQWVVGDGRVEVRA